MTHVARLVPLSTMMVLILTGGCEESRGTAGENNDGGSGGAPARTGGNGGTSTSSGGEANGGQVGAGGRQPLNNPSGPRYHPPEGFEDCVHAPVEEKCVDGWCTLPPSCFVMGSPEDEWSRGARSEDLTAVTFTNAIEMQQYEMTRAEWLNITGVKVAPPDDVETPCLQDGCPISNITWWEAIEAANMLSTQKGLAPCYEPVDCQNALGQGRFCQGVADPGKSVYECEGYRLPTRAEAEYAARGGTISTFYSGEITPQATYNCQLQPHLQPIAWYCYNSGNRVHIGGQKEANDFGLYDMLGNVREWTNDGNRIGPPEGGVDPTGAVGDHKERIVLGGRYNSFGFILRAANISAVAASSRGNSIGMRLVRTLPAN